MDRKAKHGLTPRQRIFCLEFLKDLNSTQAAIRAGYSKRTAKAAGSRLLTNVNVAAEIQKGMDRRAKRLEISADRVLQEIAVLAFANMGDYIQIQEDGSFYIDLSKLDRNQKAAIQEATVEEFTDGAGDDARPVRRMKFKLADKGQNLERLGKHLKLFTEKHEHEFNPKVVIDFSKTSAAELEQLIRGAENDPEMWRQ
jgi:phage terminase small subunit